MRISFSSLTLRVSTQFANVVYPKCAKTIVFVFVFFLAVLIYIVGSVVFKNEHGANLSIVVVVCTINSPVSQVLERKIARIHQKMIKKKLLYVIKKIARIHMDVCIHMDACIHQKYLR